MQEFSTSAINWVNHLQFGQNRERFSLVHFATDASVESNLGDDVLPAVNSLHYSGGLTNHADAIGACQGTFANSSGENIILLVTAGVPTDLDQGRASAAAAETVGTTIKTVFVNRNKTGGNVNGLTPDEVEAYMNDLGSSHYAVDSFENLSKTVDDIAYDIACDVEEEPVRELTHVAAPSCVPTPQSELPQYIWELQAYYCTPCETGYPHWPCAGDHGYDLCQCTGKIEAPAPAPASSTPPPHCNCKACTKEVWNSPAGRSTCALRMKWLTSYPRLIPEIEACNTVFMEHPSCTCQWACR